MRRINNILAKLVIPFACMLSSSAFALEETEANAYESYSVPFFGIGGGYSNVGGGVDMTMRISPKLGFNYSFYKQSETISVGNILSSDIDILNRGFSADYFPTGNNFHLTLGIQIPDNKSDFRISSPESIHSDIDQC